MKAGKEVNAKLDRVHFCSKKKKERTETEMKEVNQIEEAEQTRLTAPERFEGEGRGD